MQPTPEDAKPRRDGWHEHRGTWGEVTRGTVIASQKRTERWEIVDVAMGTPIEFGHTLWMRAREQTSGEEFTVAPRLKTQGVTILSQSPLDTKTPVYTPPSDADAIALLVQELGATELATRDHATGEITCPNYAAGHTHLDGPRAVSRGEIEHLRFAHGLHLAEDATLAEIQEAHAAAHRGAGGGFPHRHVPEDMSILTGSKR